MANDDRILDCGHTPSAHCEHTTGTAHTPDGREICWDCSYVEEKRQMHETPHGTSFFCYLSGDGNTLTTWPGQRLLRVTYLRKHYHNIGGTLVRLRAVDDETGQAWYGTSPGRGMYARVRKMKGAKPCAANTR